ncbi:MAG: hypothetical protein AAB949_01400, partial [Patescibacteria group bacterium]
MSQNKPADVPQLVRKFLPGHDMLFGKMNILVAHILPDQAEAGGISAVFFNQDERVNAGAE